MEGLMEKQMISAPNKTPPILSMHKNSHTISKVKPKIRIIHIFAPEIIKTDVANFRELVQRLTGKPTADGAPYFTKKKKPRMISTKKPEQRSLLFSPGNEEMEVRTTRSTGIHAESDGGFRERIKGEEEIWKGANSGGGFLGGFADQFDGFMQEFNHFPFLEGTMPTGSRK